MPHVHSESTMTEHWSRSYKQVVFSVGFILMATISQRMTITFRCFFAQRCKTRYQVMFPGMTVSSNIFLRWQAIFLGMIVASNSLLAHGRLQRWVLLPEMCR